MLWSREVDEEPKKAAICETTLVIEARGGRDRKNKASIEIVSDVPIG